MNLYFEDQGRFALKLECEDLARDVIDAVLDDEECPYEVQVELLLTDNENIRELNAQHRSLDQATDVLSFPMAAFESPADFDSVADNISNFDPESGELLLGNIVMSKERVLAQAEEYGHSIKREYAFLLVHSVLHLLGYDHMEEEERRLMEDKQNEILTRLNILR